MIYRSFEEQIISRCISTSAIVLSINSLRADLTPNRRLAFKSTGRDQRLWIEGGGQPKYCSGLDKNVHESNALQVMSLPEISNTMKEPQSTRNLQLNPRPSPRILIAIFTTLLIRLLLRLLNLIFLAFLIYNTLASFTKPLQLPSHQGKQKTKSNNK